MNKRILVTIMLLFSAQPVVANPIIVGEGRTLSEQFALVAEALIVAIVLYRFKFSFMRIFYTWIPVTFLTYIVLMYGGSMIASLIKEMPPALLFPYLIFIETIIILIESVVIFWLSKKMFYRNAQDKFKWSHSLSVSLAANVASVLLGIFLLVNGV